MQCRSLRESGARLKNFELAYFMASVDDVETNRAFAEHTGADFPVLSDPDKTAARTYGVLTPGGYAARWTFYIGPDGRIRAIDKEVEPGSAGADTVQKLEELDVPRRGGPGGS